MKLRYYYRVGRQHLKLRRRGAILWALLCRVDQSRMAAYRHSMNRATGHDPF